MCAATFAGKIFCVAVPALRLFQVMKTAMAGGALVFWQGQGAEELPGVDPALVGGPLFLPVIGALARCRKAFFDGSVRVKYGCRADSGCGVVFPLFEGGPRGI
jgi:hypothetical protein